MIGRKHLGQSFQMLVPIEGDNVPFEQEVRFNNINGIDQKSPEVIKSENSVTFVWKNLYSPANKKKLPINFTATASLEDGKLVFSGKVENKSDFVVEYVAWPYFGEFALPDKDSDFYLETRNYKKNIYPQFPSEHGYWGVEYHTTMAYLPSDSYIMLHNAGQGMVISSPKEVNQFMIGSFELCPGYGIAYRHPDTDTIDGQDVRVIFKANRVLYAPKGSITELEPLEFAFYEGNWDKGIDIVRNAPKEDDSWVGQDLVWRKVTAANPDNLLSIARESKANGVDVLLVSGWYNGASDNLVQYREGFREAVSKCKEMGLKVVLDTEFMRADFYSPMFNAELRGLAVSDPYGYRYNSRTLCSLSKRVQQLVEESFDKTFTELNADGVSCNDIQFRVKTMFCHDPKHGHSVHQYTDSAMVSIDERFVERAKKYSSDIKVGGTYQFDKQNDYFDYMVLPKAEDKESIRYQNPGMPIVAQIDIRNARADINNCIKNRYAICYGPLFRTGSLSSYPNVLKYVKAVEAFRNENKDFLWDADMINYENAKVKGCSSFSVLKSGKNGKRAVLLVNPDSRNNMTVSVSFSGSSSAEVAVSDPETDGVRIISGEFEIPPLSVALAIEQKPAGLAASLPERDTKKLQDAGMGFEMTLRRPDGSTVAINANKQDAPDCKMSDDGIVLTWKNLKANDGKETGISFTGNINYDEMSGMVFNGNVSNGGEFILETMNWPVINNIKLPENNDELLFRYLTYTALKTTRLYPELEGGYTGGCNLPEHAFATVGTDKGGLYISCYDHTMKEYVRVEYELTPTKEYNENLGLASASMDYADRRTLDYNVKSKRHIFVHPGEDYSLSDVVVIPYQGDWQAAADIYKKWRATWFKAPHRPAWVEDVNAWQQLQINSSESRINFKVKDLVSYAKDCKKYGVDAIQLTGWNWGGQDRGVPVCDLDPRLGTTKEFKKAIAKCHAMGVKILLFTKFVWAEYSAPWYKDYEKFVVTDADGEKRMHGGYRYNTYTQLSSFNNRRFGILCFLEDECREMLHKEFKKCLDLGAAGMVFDENQHHSGVQLCYNPEHHHKVASYVYRGDQLLGKEFYEMTRKYSPEFIMTGEGCYDNEGQYYATYTRATVDHTPLMRYIDSDLPIVCTVTDHRDFNRVNMCLMNRYVISYEPRGFKGRLSEIPEVMEYGAKVDALRRMYKDQLWNVIFNSTLGADVTGDDILYSVLNSKVNGKKAVVILNSNPDHESEAVIDLGGISRDNLMIVTPEHPEPMSFKDKVKIKPQGVIVVIEK
ncbi:MAG: DUF6259 domain-containing protein [Candidatus Cryptobacteroides sp.]